MVLQICCTFPYWQVLQHVSIVKTATHSFSVSVFFLSSGMMNFFRTFICISCCLRLDLIVFRKMLVNIFLLLSLVWCTNSPWSVYIPMFFSRNHFFLNFIWEKALNRIPLEFAEARKGFEFNFARTEKRMKGG